MKVYWKFIIGLSVLFSGVQLNAQIITQLTSDYDTALGYHAGYNTADMNYQTAIQNAAYVKPGTNIGFNGNRALIHFDLSSIPAGSIIEEATLNLYAIGILGNLNGHQGENASLLQLVIEDWNPATVTWNNQPLTTELNQVVLPASSDPFEDYLGIDVTTLAQQMHQSGNFGFLFKLIDESATNALLFCSIDHPDAEKHPTLRLKYSANPSLIAGQRKEESLISIYPNPTDSRVVVAIGLNYSGGEFFVLNSSGQKVVQGRLSADRFMIDLSDLSSGLYVFEIMAAERRRLKIVKL